MYSIFTMLTAAPLLPRFSITILRSFLSTPLPTRSRSFSFIQYTSFRIEKKPVCPFFHTKLKLLTNFFITKRNLSSSSP
ncbi:unnamed protein product [Amoebophrya sp. A120]|nr:unnamed protein product [Amoebophrya sp. A120]|eukprot:GSA120T00007357001.1